jgi:surfeit locus 1 family protein
MVHVKKYKFKPGWPASLGTALLLPLFVALGFWQVQRADEKQASMDARERRAHLPAFDLTPEGVSLEDHRFRPVAVEGTYDASRQLLLDNQVLDHRPGYFVLTPLRLTGTDVVVLVNRGWIPLGADRRALPPLSLTQTQVRIHGTLDRFPSIGLALEGADIPSAGWPAVVQVLNAGRIGERLGFQVLPYQVLLAPHEAQGYARAWHAESLHPEKSRGYALQWFSFALVLALLYLWHGFKPKQVG